MTRLIPLVLILVNAIGTLPLRITHQFEAGITTGGDIALSLLWKREPEYEPFVELWGDV